MPKPSAEAIAERREERERRSNLLQISIFPHNFEEAHGIVRAMLKHIYSDAHDDMSEEQLNRIFGSLEEDLQQRRGMTYDYKLPFDAGITVTYSPAQTDWHPPKQEA